MLRMFRPVETCMVPTLGAALAARPRGWLLCEGKRGQNNLKLVKTKKLPSSRFCKKSQAQHTRDLQELPQR